MSFFTYLLASAPYGTLYCGHTDNLIGRVWQHREKMFAGFTAKYGVAKLVWYEAHAARDGAFRRERQIKRWERAWKVRLIEAENPTWTDLYDGLVIPDGPVHPDLVDLIDPVSRLPYPLIPAKGGGQAESGISNAGSLEIRLGSPPSRG